MWKTSRRGIISIIVLLFICWNSLDKLGLIILFAYIFGMISIYCIKYSVFTLFHTSSCPALPIKRVGVSSGYKNHSISKEEAVKIVESF